MVNYIFKGFQNNTNEKSETMLNIDFDGTASEPPSALGIARVAGKEREAKIIYSNLWKECEKIVENSPTDRLISDVVEAHKKYLKQGALLLKDLPITILSEVECHPGPHFEKIVKMAKDRGGLKVLSYTDERIVENFFNCHSVPNYGVLGSRLESVDGRLTGNFSYIVSKPKGYMGGDSVGDSAGDLELFKMTHERDYRNFVAKSDKTVMFEKALKKLGIPYQII